MVVRVSQRVCLHEWGGKERDQEEGAKPRRFTGSHRLDGAGGVEGARHQKYPRAWAWRERAEGMASNKGSR